MSEKERANYLDKLEDLRQKHLKEVTGLRTQLAEAPRTPWGVIMASLVLIAMIAGATFITWRLTISQQTIDLQMNLENQLKLRQFATPELEKLVDMYEEQFSNGEQQLIGNCLHQVESNFEPKDRLPFQQACYKLEEDRRAKYQQILDRILQLQTPQQPIEAP